MKTLLYLLVFVSVSVCGQEKTIKPQQAETVPYIGITFLSESKINWQKISEEEYTGESYRFILTTSSIYNNIYIEKIKYGMEGCCKELISTNEISVDALYTALEIEGERGNINFVKWHNKNAFLIKANKKVIKVSNIGEELISVELMPADAS